MESSYDTALCLIPPAHLWPSINRLRAIYDRTHDKWPPHINLAYPFVRPETLLEASRILCDLDLHENENGHNAGFHLCLQQADTFSHKNHSTVHLRPEPRQGDAEILHLYHQIRSALRSRLELSNSYQPHMTIAQSQDELTDAHQFLVAKASLLAPIAWDVSEISILVRSPAAKPGGTQQPMRLWGTIDLRSHQLMQMPVTQTPSEVFTAQAECEITYQFDPSEKLWKPIPSSASVYLVPETPDRLVVASYNVLAEFQWPPDSSRYPALISNILSSRAAADILVLLEITDHFAPVLLANEDIRSRYPFSTHAPPGQAGIGPFPSLLNIMVLSKFPTKWTHVPLERKHKGAAVVEFPTLRFHNTDSMSLPLVLAACHLSQGLTDDTIITKLKELQKLLLHLSTQYPHHPSIMAGDFNLTTSSYTINMAVKDRSLSTDGRRYLKEALELLSNCGFQDTWIATRIETGDSSSDTANPQNPVNLYEGEQGATFDPLANRQAAKSGDGSIDNRPQRYDRILVGDCLPLRPCGFNMFGQSPMCLDTTDNACHASDHWGVRCLLMPTKTSSQLTNTQRIRLQRAPVSLGNLEELKSVLGFHRCLPTAEEESVRMNALKLLERVISSNGPDLSTHTRGDTKIVFVPVGSFGLGVWTGSSDVDCLCIGNISTKTFFALALQKLRRASIEGISILRRVHANSGVMLELRICGIRFDLHYCAASQVSEEWPDIMKRPSSDSVFQLPLQQLAKLKPVRDLHYLRRSIPDMATYRLAHLFIKVWAKARGLYAAKLGLLGGVHITAMLVPVCKSLAHSEHDVSTMDILTSFFHHYANFDWARQVVFDPFFHKNVQYHRTFREPLCILGWHAPALNTSVNASTPTVKTIAMEFSRASSILSRKDVTWDDLITSPGASQVNTLVSGGASEFLQYYKSYIKIDARYWGLSPMHGRRFLGWLESRCIAVLVDIDRKVPAIVPRIWPGRFVEAPVQVDTNISERHACILVGLEWQDSQVNDKFTDTAGVIAGALQAVLGNFEDRIRNDEKYYDANTCWMGISVSKRSDVKLLKLDEGEWGDADINVDVDTDESDGELDFDEDEDDDMAEGDTFSGLGSHPVKGAAISRCARGSSVVKPVGAGKLRTASDVMNRLKWDSAMDSNDYIVGYLDRFTGERERALGQWKSEQTDEEFIPQHRILYFKRKSDGVLVWERASRTDEVFGSGAQTKS